MANRGYLPALQSFLKGEIDLTTGAVHWVAVDTGAYTFSSAHQYLSSIAAPARLDSSPALSGKSITNGIFDAADFTWPGFSGAVGAVVLVVGDPGTPTTCRLVLYEDTASGLPFTATGADITFTHNNTGTKIFQLAQATA